MIPGSFPTIGDIHTCATLKSPDESMHTASHLSTTALRNCPMHKLPPLMPTEVPFPASPANRGKLQAFLVNSYRYSMFHTCEHQSLPMMTGLSIKLVIDRDSKPVAYHTPIPVPLHWQEEVKAGLDQDVMLGVIEPVPIGTPVTWCHHMVICAKKTGKLQRTVDFQALNAHATRANHHTQSPFHQVRAVPHGKWKLYSTPGMDITVWHWTPRTALHHLHRPMGPLLIPYSTHRVHCFGGWVLPPL